MIRYLFIINTFSFLLYGIDKYKAIRKDNRISELTLLAISFFGSLGAILGMFLFHHKTRKIKFKILIPLFLIINCLILITIKLK